MFSFARKQDTVQVGSDCMHVLDQKGVNYLDEKGLLGLHCSNPSPVPGTSVDRPHIRFAVSDSWKASPSVDLQASSHSSRQAHPADERRFNPTRQGSHLHYS